MLSRHWDITARLPKATYIGPAIQPASQLSTFPKTISIASLAQGIKLAQVIAEKDYINGDYTFLTGSWGYDNLWSTPTSMTSHMFLDPLGYNQCVEQHIELFRKHQGSVKPRVRRTACTPVISALLPR